MKWYQQLQFVSAVPMPEDLAKAYGTTVNGMWCSPEFLTDESIEQVHTAGGRILFSVPLIALVPRVYNQPEYRYLMDAACRDIYGNPSLVPWYYWEKDPVYSLCFYNTSFRTYLLERCKSGIQRGMDVVNLDEINTSLGLMDREPESSGFCVECLMRFRKHLQKAESQTPRVDAELVEVDDDTLRQRLREDDALYQRYHQFHDQEAFRVVVDFIQELRAYAGVHNPQFAITANLAYLGNVVPVHGDLWGPMWGEFIDFVMMENIYESERGEGHLLLPRGKFAAWYRLASAFSSHAPAWICPSIMVPKQLAGEKHTTYYLLMFVEAYANNGRFGYYWWPGVDVETRLKATAPEELKDYIRFFKHHRRYFEGIATDNSIAILYLNSSMRVKPEAHLKYLALAQSLAEAGYQFDVIYSGDDIYSPGELNLDVISHYKTILVPEAGYLTGAQVDALARLSENQEVELVLFGPRQGLVNASFQDEAVLYRFWKEYHDDDRQQIFRCFKRNPAAQVRTSQPLVNAVRYTREGEHILHLLNYDYDSHQNLVQPVENLRVEMPWDSPTLPEIRWLSLDGETLLDGELSGGVLSFDVPRLDLYGLAILK